MKTTTTMTEAILSAIDSWTTADWTHATLSGEARDALIADRTSGARRACHTCGAEDASAEMECDDGGGAYCPYHLCGPALRPRETHCWGGDPDCPTCQAAAESAASAAEHAMAAIDALASGDHAEALRAYGDAPTYGPLVREMTAAARAQREEA